MLESRARERQNFVSLGFHFLSCIVEENVDVSVTCLAGGLVVLVNVYPYNSEDTCN